MWRNNVPCDSEQFKQQPFKFNSIIHILKYSAKITGISHKILTEACLSNPIMNSQMWANRSICSYSDFNLAYVMYVAEFQYKTGYATKKRLVWKPSAKITGISHKILTEACLSNPIMNTD
jgi:hypothetical protein